MKKKIVVTGGSGRFGKILKSYKSKHILIFPNKKEFNILNEKKMMIYLKKIKPKIIIHLAGLSRPMNIHEKKIELSINLNIIGTANITKVCKKLGIKLIYFSTNYVYPGVKGNYKETDPLKPINNYAWSKLGGETSVHLYKNSLILRVCMTENPFVHNQAFTNVKTSFIYHNHVPKILFKVLDKKGIINLGGKAQSIYNFAKKDNKKIKKIFLNKNNKLNMALNTSININKLKNIIKNNK